MTQITVAAEMAIERKDVRWLKNHIIGLNHHGMTDHILATRRAFKSVWGHEIEDTKILTAQFDVTGMTDDEIEGLTLEVVVQGESSDNHGEATVLGVEVR